MKNLIKVSILIVFLSFPSFGVFAQDNQFVRQKIDGVLLQLLEILSSSIQT